jgi:hypothetical protein
MIVAITVLALVVGIMAVANLLLIKRTRAIYYTWLGAGVLMARPGEVPRQAIEQLSVMAARTLGNVNPEGAESAMRAVAATMTAAYRVRFLEVMKPQIEIMRQAHITMLLQNVRVDRIENTSKGGTVVYQAYLKADRMLYVGDLALEPHTIEIMVESYPVIVQDRNIYGLWINAMRWPRLPVDAQHVDRARQARRHRHRSAWKGRGVTR